MANDPGAVAQLGERSNRTAEVRGSIPLGSTINYLNIMTKGGMAKFGCFYIWFGSPLGHQTAQSHSWTLMIQKLHASLL